MKLVSVLAVDPGVTTGVAWGTFDIGAETVGEMLVGGLGVGWAELTGSEQWQAAQIVDAWHQMRGGYFGAEVFEFVIEDFILRPGRATAGREMLAPVRLTSLIEGLIIAETIGTDAPLGEDGWEFLRTPAFILQTPSAAKSFATKERLTRWGAWHKGMRHARDAFRHIALRLATLGGE